MSKQHGKPHFTGVAAFQYISVCCSAAATKDPCVWAKEDRKENKFSQGSLGHWHCRQCGKNCKVRRTKPVKAVSENISRTGFIIHGDVVDSSVSSGSRKVIADLSGLEQSILERDDQYGTA